MMIKAFMSNKYSKLAQVVKVLGVTCLFLGAGYPLMAQKKKGETDWANESLKGRVKEMKIRGFRADAGPDKMVLKGAMIHTTTKSYTDHGYLLESTSSIGGNSINGIKIPYRSARIVYKYDKNDNLLGSCSYNTYNQLEDSSIHVVDEMGNRMIWKIFKGNGVQEWEYVSEYDNTGHLLETSDYHWGKLIMRHTYRNNDYGKCIMQSDYGPDARLVSKKTFSYDDRWNKIEETAFKGNGSFDVRHTYKYDGLNRMIEEREYASDLSEQCTLLKNTYDNEGNVIHIEQYDERGKLVYEGKFDSHGNHLSDISYNADGSIREKVTAQYKYDAYDNEIEEILKLAERMSAIHSVYNYDYDMTGNWVKKTVYEDGEPVRIAEREISYY